MKTKIWPMISAIVGIIMLIFVLYNFFILGPKREKSISAEIISTSNMLNENITNSEHKLQCAYNNEAINNYSLIQVKMTNDGGQPIRESDIEKSISIYPSDIIKIVKSDIVSSDPKDLGIVANINGNHVELKKALLNKKDNFIVELGLIPQKGKTPFINKISGRIIGVKEIKLRSINESDNPLKLPQYVLIIFAILFYILWKLMNEIAPYFMAYFAGNILKASKSKKITTDDEILRLQQQLAILEYKKTQEDMTDNKTNN
jgi:hypothetical protein